MKREKAGYDIKGRILSVRGHKTGRLGRLAPAAACAMAVMLLTGCGSLAEEEYTREELEDLARLELYEAGSDELLRTIEDGETLYQYLQATAVPEADNEYYEYEADDEYYEYGAWGDGELKEAAENAGAAYYLVAYKYPAAKFGGKEPEKVYTVTLYRDVKIAKMTAAEGVVKVIDLPEEMLTVYYEMSEEEADFYESLLTQE